MSRARFWWTFAVGMLLANIVVLALLLAFQPVSANHGAYTANVREARQWARQHMNDRNWRCLDRLVHAESGWSVRATNPVTGAYGLPQALPPRKMAIMGPGWRVIAKKQIKWLVIHYIRRGPRYGNACDAWRSVVSRGWY